MDHESPDTNQNLSYTHNPPSIDHVNTSFYYNKHIYKDIDNDNYEDMNAPYMRVDPRNMIPHDKSRASYHTDKDIYNDFYKNNNKDIYTTLMNQPLYQSYYDPSTWYDTRNYGQSISHYRDRENPRVKFPPELIPTYEGNADMSTVFCQSILNVRDSFGPESEPWILNALISKLRGQLLRGSRQDSHNTKILNHYYAI